MPDPFDEPEAAVRRPPKRGFIGPFSARQVVGLIVSVVAVGVLIVVITTPLGPAPGSVLPNPRATSYVIGPATTALAVGAPAPEFTVTRPNGTTFQLTDLDGKPIRLADLRGKLVWLNFWASWCPPCQAETPVLRQVSREYRDRGLVLIAIEVQETIADGRRYAQTYGLDYTIGADVSGDIFHLYHAYALPTQFLIGSDGRLLEVINGPFDLVGARGVIGALLAASPPAGSGSPSAGSPPPSAGSPAP